MENTTVIVYRLGAGCDLSDVEEGKVYQAKVQGFATFGMFAQINDRIKGLVHKSNIKAEHKERDPILVKGPPDPPEWQYRSGRSPAPGIPGAELSIENPRQ